MTCLRCKSLAMGKTSPDAVALAEEVLGPHVCESNRSKIVVWLARDALGEIRGGCDAEVSLRTSSGWKHIHGYRSIHISEDESAEAMGEICVRAHDARLMHCDVDTKPWPDAPGPWRLEIPLASLQGPVFDDEQVAADTKASVSNPATIFGLRKLGMLE